MNKNFNIKKLFGGKSLDSRKARAGYVFVLPFLLGILLIYLPILFDSIWVSFSSYEFNGQTQSIVYKLQGIDNYATALKSANYLAALLEGMQRLIFEVPAVIIFSLFIAVVLNQKMLGRAMFRAIFFVPVIIATGLMETINAQAADYESDPNQADDGTGETAGSGLINMLDIQALFSSMKIGGELVTYIVGLVNDIYNIINYSGVQMLIFLAGLQGISPAIYEACQIEGATGWETFWKVTFPMISPMILVNAIYTIIDSFTRSQNPAMKYIASVYSMRQELATAMSWIYFILVGIVLAVVAGIASSFVFYQRRD